MRSLDLEKNEDKIECLTVGDNVMEEIAKEEKKELSSGLPKS
mgnify:CR=1 FL=1